ncbi:hypothetical protein [Xanthomonas maliensis]|uniref:hypothetical protein n=1 Tax=Xanthomonas maliensis TaxID=1321368 RepID=UPI00126480F8|nr:hypothetical protein [Xanthomonas maliensis]
MIARLCASAIGLLAAYVLVAGILASVGISNAHAGILGCTAASECDEGKAQALARQRSTQIKCYDKDMNLVANPNPGAVLAEQGTAYYPLTCGGVPTDDPYRFGAQCNSRPDYNGPFPGSQSGTPVSGSYQCNSGCIQTWTPNADGTWNGGYGANQVCDPNNNNCGPGFHYNTVLAMCEPDLPPECPNGQTKNAKGQCEPSQCPAGMTLQQDGTCAPSHNECPPGQVKSPSGSCLPGDGQCAKGEVMGADGTCKKDSDGDGSPDDGGGDGDGDKHTFSGGDDCDTPPSCNGDPIMCGQARIQWRIDCNTRRNRNISGGSCANMPVCTGDKCDAIEYNALLFQWRTACATEKLAQAGAGSGNTGQPDWTKVGNMSQDPGAGASPDDTKVLTTNQVDVNSLDQSGFGGGQCVGFVNGVGGSGISSGFMQTLASPPPLWCNFIDQVKAIMILIGAVSSAFILAKMGNT